MLTMQMGEDGGWEIGRKDFPCRRDSLSKGQEIRHNMMFK